MFNAAGIFTYIWAIVYGIVFVNIPYMDQMGKVIEVVSCPTFKWMVWGWHTVKVDETLDDMTDKQQDTFWK